MSKKNAKENEDKVNDITHVLKKDEFRIIKYKLYINEFDNIDNNKLSDIIFNLSKCNPWDTIEINICSSGGYVFELQRLVNTIKENFEGRITTKLNPYGYSCGGLMFLIGDTRIVYEHSEIMLHDIWNILIGQRQQLKNRYDFLFKTTKKYIQDYLSPYLTKEEIKELEKSKEFYFDSLEMLQRGIATHIMINGDLIPKDDYLKNINKKKK